MFDRHAAPCRPSTLPRDWTVRRIAQSAFVGVRREIAAQSSRATITSRVRSAQRLAARASTRMACTCTKLRVMPSLRMGRILLCDAESKCPRIHVRLSTAVRRCVRSARYLAKKSSCASSTSLLNWCIKPIDGGVAARMQTVLLANDGHSITCHMVDVLSAPLRLGGHLSPEADDRFRKFVGALVWNEEAASREDHAVHVRRVRLDARHIAVPMEPSPATVNTGMKSLRAFHVFICARAAVLNARR